MQERFFVSEFCVSQLITVFETSLPAGSEALLDPHPLWGVILV
jgi:hypothetical protein